jgi:hypothetical protein
MCVVQLSLTKKYKTRINDATDVKTERKYLILQFAQLNKICKKCDGHRILTI